MTKVISWEKYEFEFGGHEGHEEESEVFNEIDEMDDLSDMDIPVVMNTPFGLFRVDDSMNPFKRFEFRMGHTNFDITPSIMNQIQEVPGVEVLLVSTRYRFIIATGKLFDFGDVRLAIEREVCGKHKTHFLIDEINNKTIKEKVQTIHDDIKASKYWVIYVFPNGSVEYYKSEENSDDFYQNEILLTHASQVSGGILITSENEYE
jgi:hypothetical protein